MYFELKLIQLINVAELCTGWLNLQLNFDFNLAQLPTRWLLTLAALFTDLNLAVLQWWMFHYSILISH